MRKEIHFSFCCCSKPFWLNELLSKLWWCEFTWKNKHNLQDYSNKEQLFNHKNIKCFSLTTAHNNFNNYPQYIVTQLIIVVNLENFLTNSTLVELVKFGHFYRFSFCFAFAAKLYFLLLSNKLRFLRPRLVIIDPDNFKWTHFLL